MLERLKISFLATLIVFVCLVLLLVGFENSAQAQVLTAPYIFPPSQSYIKPEPVTLYAPSGSIYFTTDGTTPTISSTLYTAPITVSSPTQINAVAYQSSIYSPVSTAYFDVDPALAPVLQNGLILRLSRLGLVTGIGTPAPVMQWNDLSGSANNAFALSTNQPNLVDAGHGVLAVNFNGSSQYLSLPSGFNYGASGLSIFLVVQPTSPSTGARFFDLGNGSASDNIYMSEPSSNGADFHIYKGATDSYVSSSSAITLGQFQLLEGSYNGTNTATIYTNGTQDAQNASMQTANNLVRSNNFIGQASGGGNYYSGNIVEVLLFATQLSVSQKSAIEAYFISKYQLLSATPRAPIISVAGGVLSGPTQVAIVSQPGTATYITTDGTTPTSSSPVYNGGPITINYTQTLKAISIKNGLSSSVATATYTLNSGLWPVPVQLI